DDAMWQFTVKGRTYSKMDRASAQQMLAKMPPQARAMMEKIRAAASGGHTAAWVDTGKTQRVGEYTCKVWERTSALGQNTICIVPFASLPAGSELSSAFQKVGAVVKEVMSAFPMGASASALEQYAKFQGIAASYRDEYGETYLKSVEQKS